MNKILKQIKEDNLKARKEKNKFLSTILTTLIGEIVSVGKNNGNRETTEEETIKMIEKFKKDAERTLVLIENKENSTEEINEYLKEISIYESYLPKKLSKEELEKIIENLIAINSNPNIGLIMGKLKSLKLNFDGKIASQIIKEKL
jgi:hypothetical protein